MNKKTKKGSFQLNCIPGSYKTNSRCLLLHKVRKLEEQPLDLVMCCTEVPEISLLFHL